MTSVPVFTVGVGSYDQPQPFRCGKCLRWIIYCDEIIRLCSKNEEPDTEYVDCHHCSFYKDFDKALNECPYIIYHGRAKDYYKETRVLRYHYTCVKGDPEVTAVLKRAKTPKLVAPIPWLSGLEYLPKDT